VAAMASSCAPMPSVSSGRRESNPRHQLGRLVLCH
jgi:hypothetical protein